MITAFYAGWLAPLYLVLSVQVISMRRASRVTLGDGGNILLVRRLRAHQNFAEYVPLILLLLLLIEMQAGPIWSLHLLGIGLLIGRVVHAYGVSREPEPLSLRVIGMALTLSALGLSALTSIAVFLFG